MRLPRSPAPRPLTAAEAAALKARPWPRLPWWLWLAALATTVAMVAVAVGLARAQRPTSREPPGHGFTHDVGEARVFALEPANAARVVRRAAGCPRLDQVTLVGTPREVELLELAAEKVCALRSRPGIERARQGLQRARPLVAFAVFRDRGTPAASTVRPGVLPGVAGMVVLVNGGFSVLPPERIAVLLVHEGTHLAEGGVPDARGELEARLAELTACDLAFGSASGLQPNLGCVQDAALRDEGAAKALAELRREGYR